MGSITFNGTSLFTLVAGTYKINFNGLTSPDGGSYTWRAKNNVTNLDFLGTKTGIDFISLLV